LNDNYTNLVWRILRANPIEVYDEEQKSVWQSRLWELSVPRVSGAYSGERKIGSANMITAFNLLKLKLVSSVEDPHEIFKQCLIELEAQNLIRHNPETKRKTFKVV
jgi:hypothetical protein